MTNATSQFVVIVKPGRNATRSQRRRYQTMVQEAKTGRLAAEAANAFWRDCKRGPRQPGTKEPPPE